MKIYDPKGFWLCLALGVLTVPLLILLYLETGDWLCLAWAVFLLFWSLRGVILSLSKKYHENGAQTQAARQILFAEFLGSRGKIVLNISYGLMILGALGGFLLSGKYFTLSVALVVLGAALYIILRLLFWLYQKQNPQTPPENPQ